MGCRARRDLFELCGGVVSSRFRMVCLLAGFAVLLLTIVGGAAATGTAAWPQFRYGPEHTGLNSAETTIGVGNVATLAQAWTADTRRPISTSPAVVGGVVYTT